MRIQSALDKGEDPFGKVILRVGGARFLELMERYLQEKARDWQPSSAQSARESLRMFLRLVGDLPLRRIGREEVTAFIDGMLKRGAVSTVGRRFREYSACSVNIRLRNLKAFLRWIENEDLVKGFRAPRIRQLPVEASGRRDYFRPEEIQKIISTARQFRQRGEPVDRYFAFLVLSGMRKTEAMRVRWEDLDWNGGWLHVQASNTKSRRARDIPLTDPLRRVLATWRRQDSSGLLFPNVRRDISKLFRRICINAGVAPRKLHNLRDTCAVNLIQSGVPESVVMYLLGHSDIRTTIQNYVSWQREEVDALVKGARKSALSTSVLRGLVSR